MTKCFTAGGSPGALATSVALLHSAIPGEAHAPPLGWHFALCFATPGTPTTYAACVEPITKLWSVLATGGSFPVCEEASIAFRQFGDGPVIAQINAYGSRHYYSLARDTLGDFKRLVAGRIVIFTNFRNVRVH